MLGWITNEYLLLDYDEDETQFTTHCRAVAARVLSEHLWNFTDALFDADIAKSITKAAVLPDNLKIGPVSNGVSSSNAYPPVKKALELLILFDRAMPKGEMRMYPLLRWLFIPPIFELTTAFPL